MTALRPFDSLPTSINSPSRRSAARAGGARPPGRPPYSFQAPAGVQRRGKKTLTRGLRRPRRTRVKLSAALFRRTATQVQPINRGALEAPTGYLNSRVVPLYLIVQQPHFDGIPRHVPGKAEGCEAATHRVKRDLVEHVDRKLLLSCATRVHVRAPVCLARNGNVVLDEARSIRFSSLGNNASDGGAAMLRVRSNSQIRSRGIHGSRLSLRSAGMTAE